MEGPIVKKKKDYVNEFIKLIRKFGTTANKIKYAKKYINNIVYNFYFSKPTEIEITNNLTLFTNQKNDEDTNKKIRKLGFFFSPFENSYYEKFFIDHKVLPISNPELQYPAKKHPHIKNLWIIQSNKSKDCYYSSLYRMIRCYNLEQQIEKRIPGVMQFKNDVDSEDDFIDYLKLRICDFVDNPKNKNFIEELIEKLKRHNEFQMNINATYNENIKKMITNIDDFRFFFRKRNITSSFATQIEIDICSKLLEGIINNNNNYVINQTTNSSQNNYYSNNTMYSYNYIGVSQTGVSQTGVSQTGVSQTVDNSNSLYELSINHNLPFFYRNDKKEKGICMDWQGLITQNKIDEYNQEYQKSSYNFLTSSSNTEHTRYSGYNGLGGSYYKKQSRKQFKKQSRKQSKKQFKKQSRKQFKKKINF